MEIRKIQVKSVLTKSKLPDADWVVNPYVGCSFGCMYCYATFIGRWKHPEEEWGEFLDVKINTPEVLKKELERISKKLKTKDFGSIFFSSVTDPYVGVEVRHKITRRCLEVLTDFGYEGSVDILTKSPLVIRDIDLFKKFKKCSVGFTVTTTNDKVAKFLEIRAPSASSRLKSLKKLHESGIDTYAFVGPLLPHFTTNEEELNKLFRALEDVGVRDIYIEHINLSPNIRERLFSFLRKESPGLIPKFEKTRTQEYMIEVGSLIYKLIKKTKLRIVGGKVLYHPEDSER